MIDVQQLRLPENMIVPVLAGTGDQDELFDVEKVRELYDLIPVTIKNFWSGKAQHMLRSEKNTGSRLWIG